MAETIEQFSTKLSCGSLITIDFPQLPKKVKTQCTCGVDIEVEFKRGVWCGLYVSNVRHIYLVEK
jgi:hypothetical protein